MGRQKRNFIKITQFQFLEEDIVNIKMIRDQIKYLESDRSAIRFALDLAAKAVQGQKLVHLDAMMGEVPTLSMGKVGRPMTNAGRPLMDPIVKAQTEIEREDAKKQYKEIKKSTRFMATCTLLGGDMTDYEGVRLCTYKRYRKASDGVTVYTENHTIPEDAGLDEWAKKDQFKDCDDVREDVRRPIGDRVFKYVEWNQPVERGGVDDETQSLLEQSLKERLG